MSIQSNSENLAGDIGSFYDWIRDDWIAISSQSDGNNAGLLNFGLWENDVSNLFDAQMALHHRITRRLGNLSADSRGLEIGCGIGGTAIRLTSDTEVRLTCLDLVEGQLAIARKRALLEGVGGKIEFRQGNSMAMPFLDGQFDFSYCIESSFHYPDVPAFLKENMRVLKPGAVGVIADITCERPEAIVFRQGNFFYSFQTMKDWLLDVGFEVLALDRLGENVFEPLYRYMCSLDSGKHDKLRRYWRLVLKNYAELAVKGEMGYDVFVVRKPCEPASLQSGV